MHMCVTSCTTWFNVFTLRFMCRRRARTQCCRRHVIYYISFALVTLEDVGRSRTYSFYVIVLNDLI